MGNCTIRNSDVTFEILLDNCTTFYLKNLVFVGSRHGVCMADLQDRAMLGDGGQNCEQFRNINKYKYYKYAMFGDICPQTCTQASPAKSEQGLTGWMRVKMAGECATTEATLAGNLLNAS